MWFRVDNRLVHGQVIEAWLPYTGAKHLVVANDELAGDFIRQQIIELAVPHQIKTHFISLKELAVTLDTCGDDCFVLFANCQDARRACDAGIFMSARPTPRRSFVPFAAGAEKGRALCIPCPAARFRRAL